APLLANNALRIHGPREAAPAVIKGSAEADGIHGRGDANHPAFFCGSDAPDSAGGTNFGAENATRFAVADAGDECWSPKAFESCFSKGGLQRVVRADLHALAATDAAGEEVGLVE